jgi:hypothetical protein
MQTEKFNRAQDALKQDGPILTEFATKEISRDEKYQAYKKLASKEQNVDLKDTPFRILDNRQHRTSLASEKTIEPYSTSTSSPTGTRSPTWSARRG